MSRPFSSLMADVSAVSVSPTWTVPAMVGCPVAATFSGRVTASVAVLVRVSENPSSSVKATRTLTAFPSSSAVSL